MAMMLSPIRSSDIHMQISPDGLGVNLTCPKHRVCVECSAFDFQGCSDVYALARRILVDHCVQCAREIRKANFTRHPLDPAYEEKQ